MHNKLGGIVMIEPNTGEVLCMVSSPTFDPGILVGRKRGKNHDMLEKDPNNTLYGRAFMASYPPGYTFKPAQGLIFLQENVITTQTMYTCAHGYPLRNGKPACHWHASPLNIVSAVATSCNAYFCWGLHDLLDSRKRYPNVQTAFEVWKNHIVSMGYGHKLGIDLPGENRGFIPNSKTYDKAYRKKWNSNTIISIAIGQGEILASPLQICNVAATIANKGYFYTPHVVKKIQDMALDTLYTRKRHTTIEPKYYEIIAEGMRAAVTSGTCRLAAIPDIEVCGKTGTVENPRGKDHSVFMGFAPYNDPKVAIAVFVENAGFGATYAVPIGRLMLEKYLTGTISPASKFTEEYIKNAVITPTNVY
jgi:penicillin-binding protein 2